jgi:hypothetical protein
MRPNGRKKFVQPIPELIWLRSERKKCTQRSLFDVAAQKVDSEIFQLRRCAAPLAPDDLFRHAWTCVSHAKFFNNGTQRLQAGNVLSEYLEMQAKLLPLLSRKKIE